MSTILTPSGHLLPSRVFSAPMAGYTDPPYRRLLQEFEPIVLFTEMIDSHALIYQSTRTKKMLGTPARNIHIQIAAGTASLADKATDILLEDEIHGINVNMGCPAKKVVSCGGGSNLLRAPQTIRDICKAIRKKTQIPFSVKFRSGWNALLLNYLEIGKIFEGEGVDFVMLHARTRAEAFSGRAHWDHIRHLKESLRIPVIGNGDIVSYESAKALYEQTACDGIAIGRGAIGNPWLYRQVARALNGLPPLPEPSPEERLAIILKHYRYILDYYEPYISNHIFRKHLVGYLRGLPGQKAIKEIIFKEEALTTDRLEYILSTYFHKLGAGLANFGESSLSSGHAA